MSYLDNAKKEMEINKNFNSNSGGNDWFKMENGDNTIRILTEPKLMFEKFGTGICYTDCGYQGSAKFLMWIFDQKDSKIKLCKLGYTLGEQVLNLESDADYGFKEFPMPYSITIKADKAGTKEVSYSAPLPRPVKVLPDNIRDEIAKRKSISEIIERMKANQKEKHMKDGTFQKNQDSKKDIAEARTATVQEINAEARGYEYPEEEISPKDIPF